MFRYLVENHGFKIFAIEADFGESVLINEAVMNSDKSQIEGLMKETMHFWTWRTTEVRDLLYWMCDYNLGKTEEEKVQYWGVDCQYNTYHPDMALAYLDDAGVSFISYAQTVLAEANEATATQFSNYTKDQFDNYVQKLDALKDSLAKYETQIINATSAKHFLLTLQFVELTRQSSEVAYYAAKQTATKNYRDEYMAKNTSWLHDYFDGGKIVLWAHNFHVSDYEQASTGYFLSKAYPSDYAKIGFLFSKGTFTARKHTNEGVGELGTQSLEDDPKPGSLNDVMFRANADVLTVSVSDLGRYRVWQQAFYDEIEYVQMGSMYNNQPLHYYSGFNDRFFDRLIYIENSTATVPLK
jgi:erythromycin esterase